jgi:hypothetical protein
MAHDAKLYHYHDLSDAHEQGWNAGLYGGQKPYINPVNDYQKEFNRGHKAGEYFKLSKGL